MSNSFVLKKNLKEIFSSMGCLEAVNYHFVGKSFQDEFLKQSYGEDEIMIQNPLNDNLNVMRKSLLCHLFYNLKHNIRYGNHRGRVLK